MYLCSENSLQAALPLPIKLLVERICLFLPAYVDSDNRIYNNIRLFNLFLKQEILSCRTGVINLEHDHIGIVLENKTNAIIVYYETRLIFSHDGGYPAFYLQADDSRMFKQYLQTY